MKEIRIQTATQNSVIYCGEGALSRLPEFLAGHKNFLLTDSNVYALYGGLIERVFGDTPKYVLPAGEVNKNFRSLESVLTAMAGAKLLRNSYLFALGGGVIGDLGGLCASLYMRGIHCVQIPTTLLAQVDSSVGGKTAVDLGGVKNVVGTFYQPEAVIADPLFFNTLPVREIRCGLGEVVKHGALNGELFRNLYQHKEHLFNLEYLASIIPLNIEHKADVVRKDEKETGLRKSLNMGHTTGHAIELYDGRLSHGEYVLTGMWFELQIAKKRGICTSEDYAKKLEELILGVLGGLPRIEGLKEALANALMDKKNETAGTVTLTVPVSRGIFDIVKLPYGEYEAAVLAAAKEIV